MLPAHHKRAVAFINNLKATGVRQELSDGAVSGLYLVVQPKPSGALSWAVRTKLDGKSAKITLGRFDDVGSGLERIDRPSSKQSLNISEARSLAERVIADVKRGHDPRLSKTDRFSLDHWLDEFVKTARSTGFKGRAVNCLLYTSTCGYVAPVYSGCNTGCGGGWGYERLPDPVQEYQQYDAAPVHQYYYADQGPSYSGPGNFAPYPSYRENALPYYYGGYHAHHWHAHSHYWGHPGMRYGYEHHGYASHHNMRYGYHGMPHQYGYRGHALRRYY